MRGLILKELTTVDAPMYFKLVARNREHLTQHGDYSDVTEATQESVTDELSDPTNKNKRCGIWLNENLIGRIDLSARAEGHYVIGYWLGSEYTGKGYATAACASLTEYGHSRLGATDIYAGVTKGNTASESVLLRNGFRLIEDRHYYSLFHLQLTDSRHK